MGRLELKLLVLELDLLEDSEKHALRIQLSTLARLAVPRYGKRVSCVRVA